MAHLRPPRKLIKLDSKATAATINDSDDGSNRSQKGINDIPTEILWKILRQAAIFSSLTCERSVKVDFKVVLLPLARVSHLWKDVIANRIWRASYFKALVAIDPTCRYKRFAKAVQVDGIVGRVQSLCVLGDELFVLRDEQDICVYAIETLDVTMKLRTRHPPKLQLKRILDITDFGLDYVANIELQSCNANNSLYISFLIDMARLSPVDGRVLVRWPEIPAHIAPFDRSVDDRTGCVAAGDLIRRRLLIYTEDGQLTRSIDISQLLLADNWLFSCVAVHDDHPHATASVNSSTFLFFQGRHVVSETSVTKFRVVRPTGKNADKIESQETVLSGSPSEILCRMSDDSGVLTMGRRSVASPVCLTAYGPRITTSRYITLTPHRNFRDCCLDSARGRLFASHSPDSDGLMVYNLRRDDMI